MEMGLLGMVEVDSNPVHSLPASTCLSGFAAQDIDADEVITVLAPSPRLGAEVTGEFMEPDHIDESMIELADPPVVLGEGRYGKVSAGLLADEYGRRVEVALKMMGAVGGADSAAFQKEIRVLRTVSQRCARVCRLYGTAVLNGKHCIVMKRYANSLSNLLGAGQLDEQRALELACQVSAALEELHENRVIIHDLKPANILLDGHGEAVIADFGISTVIEHTQSMMTMGARVAGTSNYMSPEAWNEDKHHVTKSTDVWSLACCILEMLTGKPPWDGMTEQRIMMQIMKRQQPEIPQHVQAQLGALLRQCFCFEEERRPTVADVKQELKVLQSQSHETTPLLPRERSILHWIKEDLGLLGGGASQLTDADVLIEAAASLQVSQAGSLVKQLARIEGKIVEMTEKLANDCSNPFYKGCFLSHSQGSAGPQVMLMKSRMEQACPQIKGRIWYDKDCVPTEEGMRLGVKQCSVFILFLSNDVLLRPFCRKEIRWALLYRKKILLVWQKEGPTAVTEFATFFEHTKMGLPLIPDPADPDNKISNDNGDTAEDIEAIFSTNVAIPYYAGGAFGKVSLAHILRGCGYEKQASALLGVPRISLPRQLQVRAVYTANGKAQARTILLQLEAICPAMRGRYDAKKYQHTEFSHLIVYVTSGVFADASVNESIRVAAQLGLPITCVVETDPRHGGVKLGDNEMLTQSTLGAAPMDILQPIQNSRVVPFHKDSDFRNVSLQEVLLSFKPREGAVPTQQRSPGAFAFDASDFGGVEVKSRWRKNLLVAAFCPVCVLVAFLLVLIILLTAKSLFKSDRAAVDSGASASSAPDPQQGQDSDSDCGCTFESKMLDLCPCDSWW